MRGVWVSGVWRMAHLIGQVPVNKFGVLGPLNKLTAILACAGWSFSACTSRQCSHGFVKKRLYSF